MRGENFNPAGKSTFTWPELCAEKEREYDRIIEAKEKEKKKEEKNDR
jgi:hypothetical protein